MVGERELWACPRCGRRFVSPNLWHACGPYSVEGFLSGKGPRARRLYERFEELIAACGPYEVSPAKTRVAFMARVRFAGITSVSEGGMTFHVGLPRPLGSPRVQAIQEPASGWFVHRFRVTSPEELEDEVLGWLRESYQQMGLQERLRS